MSLIHVNDFDTDRPPVLSRQLAQFEDNVGNECDSVRKASLPLPTIVAFTAVAGAVTNIVAFSAPNQLSVDSTSASLVVTFPPLSQANFGRRFTLLRRSSANSVVTVCQDTTVLCNGSLAWPAFTGATPRAIEFYCDASGYFYQ